MVKRDWRAASQYAQKKFGTTLSQIIADRETSGGDSKTAAQRMINEAYGVGSGGDDSDVRSDYNAKVDENARAKMKVANDMLDKTASATVDVLEGGQKASAKLDAMKRKKKSNKKQMYAGD